MLDRLVSLLEARPDVDAWQVRHVRHTSHQAYVIFDTTESRRGVATERCEVTVYVWNGDHLGESSFVLVPSENDIAGRVDEAVAMAGLVRNEPYELPGPQQEYLDPETADPAIVEDPKAALEVAEMQIRGGIASEPGVELSAAEVFLNHDRIRLRNSRGLDVAAEETDVFVEVALLAAAPNTDGEVESLQYLRGRSLHGLHLEDEVRKVASFARDSADAVLPPSGHYDVLFGEEALDSLFEFFVAHASGSAAYDGWARFEVDRPVLQDVRGDRITMHSDGTIPGMLGTRKFDAYGLPVPRRTVIADGVLQRRMASKRYADYLQLEPTGEWGNIVIPPGSRTIAELQGNTPVLELLRFSVFEPNELTGAFSAEIRLGYLYRTGEKVAVKGGSVSGNIASAFQRAALSRECVQRARYCGPARVRLAALDVAGA